jgi:hypothetical protein
MSTVTKTTKRTRKIVKDSNDNQGSTIISDNESTDVQHDAVKTTKRTRKTVKDSNDNQHTTVTKTTKRTRKIVKDSNDNQGSTIISDNESTDVQHDAVKTTKRTRKQQMKIVNADDILNEIVEQPNEIVEQEINSKQKQNKSKQNEDIIQHPPNKFISMSLDSITHKNEDLIETEEQQMKQRIIILERRLDEKSIEINDLKITIYNLEQRLNKVINNLYKTSDNQPMDITNELIVKLNE